MAKKFFLVRNGETWHAQPTNTHEPHHTKFEVTAEDRWDQPEFVTRCSARQVVVGEVEGEWVS